MADTLESLELEIKHKSSDAASDIDALSKSMHSLAEELSRVIPDLKSLVNLLPKINGKGGKSSFAKEATQAVEIEDKGVIANLKEVTDTAPIEKALDSVKEVAQKAAEATKKIGEESAGAAEKVKPLGWEIQTLVKGLTKYGVIAEKAELAQERMNNAFEKGDYAGAIRAREQMLNYQAQMQKEYERMHPAQVEQPAVATPLSEVDQHLISTANEIDLLKMKLESLNAAMQQAFGEGNAEKAQALRAQIINVEKALEKAEKATKGASEGVKQLAKEAKKSKSPLENFISSLKRIAFYRIIRGIIKSITQAFQEGLEKAYLFSTGIQGEGGRFAAALDRMKSASNQMKGQLGSAFMSLLAALEPILLAIINLITRVADAITQFFAAFTGNTYVKAVAGVAKFADNMKGAGKAAAEWKNQLLGFDEINRLNEPSDGGGGGSNPLDGFNFSDTPISEFIQNLVAKIKAGDWAGVATTIFNCIRDAIYKVDWQNLGAKIWEFVKSLFKNTDGAQSAAEAFFEALGAAIGALAGTAWGFIKSAVEDLMALFKKNLKDYDGDSKIGLLDILEAAWNTLGDIFDWIDEHIVLPLVKGIKQAFSGEELGADMAEGIKNGWTQFWEDAYAFFIQPIIDFVNDIKELLGIHSPSTVFQGIGEDMVQGLWNGFKEKWALFKADIEGFWNKLKSWWDGLSLGTFYIPRPRFEWTYTQAEGLIAEALKFVGLPPTIPHLNIAWYAQGGFPEEGQLFFANESGAELVGSMGGRTAVANQQEITEGIRQGVYDAVTAAMSNGERDINVKVYLDSKQIRAGQERLARAWG